MTTEIQEYTKTEAALADLSARYKGVVFDVTTATGMADAKKSRAELRTYRVDLEKTRKDIKAPALLRCQQIDSEAKRITAHLEALENPIDEQIKKEEARKEEEKLAQLRAAQAIFEAEQKAIKDAEEARMAAERAEIARQQEELAAAQAELAAAQRVARYKIEAEERAARMKIEEEERKARMEREESDRAARLQREAEEAKLKEERDRIEAERRAIEEVQRKEREAAEAKARAEREAEEAKQREIRRKEAELQDAYGILAMFVERFGHIKEFYQVVSAISKVTHHMKETA